MELCSNLCGSQDGREVWGRMGTGIFMAKPLCSLPEITTILKLLSLSFHRLIYLLLRSSLSFSFFPSVFLSFFYRLIPYFSMSSVFLLCRACFQLGEAGATQCLGSSLGWFPRFWSRAPEQWLSSCDTWALVLQGLWDLLGRGIKPISPAWEGRFLTTRPTGKTYHRIITGYTVIQIKIV